jgi:predicted tellurium resistance membrane protein TerC
VSEKLHPKLWLVVAGGMLGVIAMRFMAAMFIKLLDRFPRLETSAYLLVMLIGIKLLLDYAFNGHGDRIEFQSVTAPAFWIFWMTMAACFASGFLPISDKQAD